MLDVQMKDFRTVSGLSGAYFILVQDNGEGAKITPELVLSGITSSMRPSIVNKVWHIGSENTGVVAEGKTPVMGKSGSIIMWGYEGEGANKILADLKDYALKFSDLTAAEVDQLRLHYEQLTPAQIAELQKPANDAITAVNSAKVATEEATRNANAATTNANAAATSANAVATKADSATARANNAASGADTAAKNAQDVADHPTYIGSDQYVYVWDKSQKEYVKSYKVLSVIELTPEQVTLLQKPATDKAEEVQTAENARVLAEKERERKEGIREEHETTRQTQETSRVEAEQERVKRVDSLLGRLEQFDATIVEERLSDLEANSVRMGAIVGYDDEIDESVFTQE